MKIIFLLIVLYFVYKVVVRLVAPFFDGYHNSQNKRQTTTEQGYEQKKGKVTFRFNKKVKPDPINIDLSKADIEDADFEEIK